MQYFNSDNETSVLNDQTEETPSTLIDNPHHIFQDEHSYAKHFNNNNEASILLIYLKMHHLIS